MTAALEQSPGYEAAGAVAQLIALPEGYQGQVADDDTTNPIAGLLDATRTARGRTLLPETTAGVYGDKGAALPRKDWKPERLGANPPVGMVQLRQHVECTVLGCFGIPGAAVAGRSERRHGDP